ncbi:BamA/OMP85 family outer membrane protein [Planctomycetaceae bacterium SH139]
MLTSAATATAQMGGMGGMGGGAGGGAPPGVEKQRFGDRVMEMGGPTMNRESGDQLVREVRIVGNQQIEKEKILSLLRTRAQGFYNEQTVLADVRRLYDFRAFRTVREQVEPVAGGGVIVTFTVTELPLISNVIFHGAYRINARELKGRAGIAAGDPINETAIESTRRRLLDYYREEGFNQATIKSVIGFPGNPDEKLPPDPNAIIFRINEGEKERIAEIAFEGNTIVSSSRLGKVIESRGPFFRVGSYVGNVANLKTIDEDVTILTNYYQSLGYVMAEVDRVIEYDETLKWLTVKFLINEGPLYSVNQIRLVGNKFVDESSLRAGLKLKEGAPFSQVEMNQDVDDITYAYGSLGFIYAEVTPELRLIDSANQIDVIYRIEEGDRWKVGQIFVQIDGEPNLMRETTMLNYLDLVEGQYIDRRMLEMNRRRLIRSELLETNPTIADPPDLRLVPRDEDSMGDL